MLYSEIKSDMLKARKAKDAGTLSILSTLAGELIANAKLVDGEKVVSDEAVISLIKKYIKGLDEMLLSNRNNEQALKEKELISKYLPKMYSEDELKTLIRAVIDSGADNLGKVMAYLKQNHSGNYDGKMASEIAKNMLT